MDHLSALELEGLIDRHAAALELFARQWTASPSDVVQSAFIKLARCEPKPTEIVAWLYRVVRNGAISAARSETRRRRHELAHAESNTTWFVPTSDDRLDAVEAMRALSELSETHRAVIVARLWGGLSFEEIADVLETSSSTAHRNYQAGLALLRERLGVTWAKNSR